MIALECAGRVPGGGQASVDRYQGAAPQQEAEPGQKEEADLCRKQGV